MYFLASFGLIAGGTSTFGFDSLFAKVAAVAPPATPAAAAGTAASVVVGAVEGDKAVSLVVPSLVNALPVPGPAAPTSLATAGETVLPPTSAGAADDVPSETGEAIALPLAAGPVVVVL